MTPDPPTVAPARAPADAVADSMPPATRAEDRGGAIALLQLVMSTPDVESYLQEVANMAAELDGAIIGVGVMLRRDGRVLSVATSNELAATADEVQFGIGTGPCLDALHTGSPVVVDDMSTEGRWDGYPRHAMARGIRSSLSLPLAVEGTPVGALNTYGALPHLFTNTLADRVHTFAAQAQIALTLALRHAKQSRTVEQLHTAMQSRSTIDQALGILMARHGCTAEDAFAMLRATSQSTNRKLTELATEIISSTTGAAPRPGRFRF